VSLFSCVDIKLKINYNTPIMEVNTAIEARQVCDNLRKELSKLRYNPDLRKMLDNIEGMVSNISKIEVECRRLRSATKLEVPLKKFNESVLHLEQLLLIAKLMD
jgi:hypothetical protein